MPKSADSVRASLEELSLADLKKEALKFNIKMETKDPLLYVDAIVEQLFKNSTSEEASKVSEDSRRRYHLRSASTGNTSKSKPVPDLSVPCSERAPSMENEFPPVYSLKMQQLGENLARQMADMTQQMSSLMLEQSRQQQALMQQMFAAMNINNANSNSATVPSAHSFAQGYEPHVQRSTISSVSTAHNNMTSNSTSVPVPGAHFLAQESDTHIQRSSISSASTAQAVKLLSTHIPDFSGSEDEDVDSWIHTVERVAQIHGVPNDVLLLAATGKLKKTARKWFDLYITKLIESWSYFREAIIKRFKRPVLFHVAIQKAEARKWLFMKETFHDYAMDKLVLLRNLGLKDKDTIHLLINGIGSRSLRELASTLRVSSVDEFLEEMHNITSASGESQKKFQSFSPKIQSTKPVPSSSNKEASQQKEIFCVYCRAKGHTRDECPKLKKKDNPSSSRFPNKTPPVAVVEQQEVAASSTSSSSVVAVVSEVPGRKIEINDSKLKVVSINNRECSMWALLDTGSPISLICPSAFKKIFNSDFLSLNSNVFNSHGSLLSKFRFKGINNVPIMISDLISTSIVLQVLPDFVANIDLHVLKEDSCSLDLIIGRDFIKNNSISVLYNPSGEDLESKVLLFQEIASTEVINNKVSDLRATLSDVDIDFGPDVKDLLISTILEVENMDLPPVEDEYLVKLSLKDESVFAFSPRRFAWTERLQMREITDDLLNRGIIRLSSSPYCARVVPVKKKNGSLRLCVDMRPLNSKVIKQKYPFPLIEDCLARLSNKSIFTLLDLKDGFHQIKVHPDFTKFFAFATPDGQFEYTRLPFGFCEAPAEFQKRLIQILQPLIREDRVIVYIDDILIPSITVQDNLSVLKEVLLLLKRYNFEVNYNKCMFLKKELEYLGYILSPSGITLSVRHVEAVNNFPKPKKLVELQRFLGLTNYFRKFIKNYAKLAKPLQDLLRKTSSFNFDQGCLNAFNSLKDALTSFPVLCLYNPCAETELHTDASSLALAAILLQKQHSGQWAPISYYSQSTNKAEAQYHSYELEMLAVVKSVERFHIYLYGLQFKIVTDCNALVYALNKAHLNPRIARWTLRLQNYRFNIIHREGRRMMHVDALSRVVAYHEPLTLEQELQYRQLQDTRLKGIAEDLEISNDDKFELIEGLVYKKGSDKARFVVPESMVTNIIRAYHDEMAHCGIEKTIKGITSNYWFPSLRKRTQDYIDNCLKCIIYNVSSNMNEGELQITNNPSAPFSILHTDHFGPILDNIEGFKHILLVVDAFSRFTWLFPCKSTTSKESIKHFKFLFHTFGYPEVLISDRGTCFTSLEFTEFIKICGVKHTLVAVAAPWANGIVERINRFLKSSLKKLIEDPTDWHSWLGDTQYVINNTYHSTLKSSPSKMFLGYDQRGHTDTKLIQFLNKLAKTELDPNTVRVDAQRLASETIDKVKLYNKGYYDKHHKKPTKYNTGDYVMIRDTSIKPGESKKLKPCYKGPYLVSKVLNKN
ncbi:retrovirus-like pol polyprotein, partial [Lasius niger]